MDQFMLSKRWFCAKGFGTKPTHLWLLSQVDQHMQVIVECLPKSLITYCAEKFKVPISVSQVHLTNMSPELGGGIKCARGVVIILFTANVAAKLVLAPILLEVYSIIHKRRKFLQTQVTLMNGFLLLFLFESFVFVFNFIVDNHS